MKKHFYAQIKTYKKFVKGLFLWNIYLTQALVVYNTLAEFRSFVMNNKAFGNVFCNSQKSFHTSPGSSNSNNRGYLSFFKLNNGICIYKKS